VHLLAYTIDAAERECRKPSRLRRLRAALDQPGRFHVHVEAHLLVQLRAQPLARRDLAEPCTHHAQGRNRADAQSLGTTAPPPHVALNTRLTASTNRSQLSCSAASAARPARVRA
jgi:hypothetical protein